MGLFFNRKNEVAKLQHELEVQKLQHELEMQKLRNELAEKEMQQQMEKVKSMKKTVKIEAHIYTKPDMATEKQLRFIHTIETVLYRYYRDRSLFFEGTTKKEASIYISKHMKDFKRIQQLYV